MTQRRRARRSILRPLLTLGLMGALLGTGGVAMAQQDGVGDAPGVDTGVALPREEAPNTDKPGELQTPELEVGKVPVEVVAEGEQKLNAAQRERVKFLLSGYEYFPSRKDLDEVALAPLMAPLLRELAEDGALSPSMRSKAIDALGYYGDEQTVSYLREVALSETREVPKKELRSARARRHHAIVSYAKAGKEQALPDLEQLAMNEDVQIRLSAISAIGKHTGSAGEAFLKRMKESEADPVVQREIRKHL